ncbi:hypothetical protein ACVW1A_006408 [Bradyrhizobium sp. LB1.3]
MADLQDALAGCDVLGQHLQAAREIFAVAGHRRAQHLRIGQHEVGRRQRVGDLLDVELGLAAGLRIEPLGVAHQLMREFRREQIELHHEIEELVRLPFRIGKALVARRGRDRGRSVLASHAARRRAPEVEIVLGEPGLEIRRA